MNKNQTAFAGKTTPRKDSEKKTKEETIGTQADTAQTAGEQKDELAVAKQMAAENLAGWQRSKADFLNYKKQQEEFISQVRKMAAEDCWLQLLPVVDNFVLATSHRPRELENSEWVQGVLYIQTMLEQLLASNGVEVISTVGKQFNPQVAEAVAEVESAAPSGEVTEEVQRGYRLNGRLLRAAKVKISKGLLEENKEKRKQEEN